MSQAWQSALYVNETGQFTVDWTDEMDAASDTIKTSPAPVVKFLDSSGVEQTTLHGLAVSVITVSADAFKVAFLVSNSDWATNKTAAKANSPHLLIHRVATTAGQTLQRILLLEVSERGSELVVETGAVVAGANTWIGLEDAEKYHLRLGNVDWGGTDAERARALRRGAQYLDSEYRMRWKGTKTSATQTLTWPRADMTDEDGNAIGSGTIPQAVKDAQCEAARAVPHTQKIKFSAWLKAVGAGSARVEFASPLETRSAVELIDGLLLPYLKAGGGFQRA